MLKLWKQFKEKISRPDFHEAITQVPAPSEKLKGKIYGCGGEGIFAELQSYMLRKSCCWELNADQASSTLGN